MIFNRFSIIFGLVVSWVYLFEGDVDRAIYFILYAIFFILLLIHGGKND